MANQIAATCTLSAVGTSSNPMELDPTARTTTVLLNTDGLMQTSSNGSDVTIQVTYDYPGPPSGQSVLSWVPLSTTHFSSATDGSSALASLCNGCGVVLTVTGPIAGLRLSSTKWDSDAQTITLKALQSITAGP